LVPYLSRASSCARSYCLALLTLLAAACAREVPRPPDSSRAPKTALASVRTFSLGNDSSSTPGEITYAATNDAGVAIVDNARRRIMVYSTDGRLKWSVPFGAGDTSSVRQPNALSWWRDTLFVAEVDGSGGIWSFDTTGIARRLLRFPIETAISSVERLGDGFLVATTESDDRLERDSAVVVRWFDGRGRQRRAGCRPDQRYVESARRRGMISIFRSFSATSAGGEVYCRQPLSDDIVVMSSALEQTRRISLPGVRVVSDTRQSMDLMSINHFRSSVVEWTGLWLVGHSVVIAGASYDEELTRDRYVLLRCDEAGRTPCHRCSSEERVIGVVADSIVTVVPQRARDASVILRIALCSPPAP